MVQPRTSPLEVADAAFRAAAAGPPPLVLDGAAVGHGLPRRDVPLDEKRILLAPSTAYAARDAAVAALLGRTRSGDERWILGLTGVLLPGLRRMAGRLTRQYPGDPDCGDAEVLAGFVDGVATWDGRAGTGIASRLLWLAYRRCRQLWAQEIAVAAHRAQGEVPAVATGVPIIPTWFLCAP